MTKTATNKEIMKLSPTEKIRRWFRENIVESVNRIIARFKNIFRRRVEKVIEPKRENLESFEIKESDFIKITDTVDHIFAKELIDSAIRSKLRIRTYDQKHIYIITEGAHESTDEVSVTKLDKKFGTFNVYQIKKSNSEQENYYSANGGYNDWRIETTAKNADKYDTKGHFWGQKKNDWPDKKLMVINVPPFSGFKQTNRYPKYNYTSDYLAHELMHAEQFWLLSHKDEANPIKDGPTEQLIQIIQSAKQLSPNAKTFLVDNLDNGSLSELFAMTADMEAKTLFDQHHRLRKEKIELWKKLGQGEAYNNFSAIDDRHSKGQILSYLMRDAMPNYQERKNFLKQFWQK